MIHINTLTGDLYQTIYVSENDNKYDDLKKYIVKPVHPKFKEAPTTYVKPYSMPYGEIYVKTSFSLWHEKDGLPASYNDDIDYYSTLYIRFHYSYLNINYEEETFSHIVVRLDSELEQIENQTFDICKNFIKKNSFNIIFVKESQLTDDLIKLAIRKNTNVIKYISNAILTEDIYKYAVSIRGSCLEFIPNEMKTNEICKLAIQNYSYSIKYVKDNNEELYKYAVQKDGYIIGIIPKEIRTEEMCILAVRQNPYIIKINKEVPELNTLEIHKIVVEKYGELLQFIPIKMRTYEVCELACKKNGCALQFVPIEIRTYELYKIAVASNQNALLYIKNRTQELLDIVKSRDPHSKWTCL